MSTVINNHIWVLSSTTTWALSSTTAWVLSSTWVGLLSSKSKWVLSSTTKSVLPSTITWVLSITSTWILSSTTTNPRNHWTLGKQPWQKCSPYMTSKIGLCTCPVFIQCNMCQSLTIVKRRRSFIDEGPISQKGGELGNEIFQNPVLLYIDSDTSTESKVCMCEIGTSSYHYFSRNSNTYLLQDLNLEVMNRLWMSSISAGAWITKRFAC